ncbi:hypothetical protein MKX03_006350 [Papaver bracteatum]|nr:hypothetical protein MKX03_006350 [Papaver bracteatum]
MYLLSLEYQLCWIRLMLILWKKKMKKHQITFGFIRMRTLGNTNFSGFPRYSCEISNLVASWC